MTQKSHGAGSASKREPLYDENVATPSHAERARTMAAGINSGTLCTVGSDPAGYPYGSLVTLAFDDASPVFLISELAEHTKNLRLDRRASLLLAEGGGGDPLARGRVTLIGACDIIEAEDGLAGARESYLAAHPSASYYVDFGDFSFWRLRVESLRYIGGYGRMSWVDSAAWYDAVVDPIGAVATSIIDHMNADHSDALVAYCQAFSRANEVSTATMTGIDRLGFELSAVTPDGPRPIRLGFKTAIETAADARKALVALVAEARAQLGPSLS